MIITPRLQRFVHNVGTLLHDVQVSIPNTLAIKTIRRSRLRANTQVTTLNRFLNISIQRRQRIRMGHLTLIINNRHVSPQGTLGLIRQNLRFLRTNNFIRQVPLLRRPVVFRINITRTMNRFVIPVRLTKPLRRQTRHQAMSRVQRQFSLTIELFSISNRNLFVRQRKFTVRRVAHQVLEVRLRTVRNRVLK